MDGTRRSRWWRGAVGAALLALVGCTVPPSSVLPATVGLGDAEVAVYITKFTNDNTDGGRVVLYDRSGPTSMVTHTGIRAPGLIWDDAGLFFVDQKTDFQVSDQVERNTRSRAADTLVGMQGGENGRRVVLFNDGLSKGKNHTGVGVYDGVKEVSQQTLLDSMGDTFASCSGGVWLGGAMTVTGDWSELVRLDPPGGVAPLTLGERRGGILVGSPDAPCVDGRVVALWYPDSNSHELPLEVWQWSVSDGAVKRTPLVGAAGRFTIAAKTLLNGQVPSWVVGGGLVWVDSTGVAWRSDLKTGVTAKIRDGLADGNAQINSWVKSGDWVVHFVYAADQLSAKLLVYSAKDLSLVETRELPRLAELTPSDQMVLAVAVRPGYKPGK